MRAFLATMLIAAALSAAFPAFAQAQPKPTNLQPVPEPPPPPKGFELDQSLEPQVTIIKRGTDTVEEYRIGGRLYMIKVTPAGGVPFYMVDERGDGKFSRQESYDSGVRPPQWVIFTF